MITIAYINYWNNNGDPQDRWFTNFIKSNIDNDITEVSYNQTPDILICSCFCGMEGLDKVHKSNAPVKIFFSGENLYRYPPYHDMDLLKNTFDLNLIFKYDDFKNKIVRFPFWLMYYQFYKMDKDNNIISYLENVHMKNIHKPKNIFGTLVARHDRLGHRTVFLKELEKYGEVLCPSKFNNNCSDIGKRNHNKLNFVSKSKYNICPENSEFEGYYTEKVFEALECGSVPIYWAISEPEPDILCKNKYCFIKNIHDPSEVRDKIKDVIDNYDTYKRGNIFLPNAHAIINNYYETLKSQLIKLLVLKTNKGIVTPPNYIFDCKHVYTLNSKDNTTHFVNDKL